LRGLLPKLDTLVTTADGLVDDGAEPVALFSEGLRGLSERVQTDQVPALEELVELVDLLFEYRFGLVQFAEVISSVTSMNRQAGPFAQFAIVNAEATPEGLGFPAAAARSQGGEASELETQLAAALEATCAQNPAACLLRFRIPGLPSDPVLDEVRKELSE